jgi:hypothetical protein
VTAGLEPQISALRKGESLVFTYVPRPENAPFNEVIWINEHPLIVRVEPLIECGAKCARVTALSLGEAQLRSYALINGGRIEAPHRIAVFE